MHLNKKHILSWVFFDFANSSYSAVIASVIFPVYYVQTVVGNETGIGDIWWGRAISLSMAFVALTSPFMGGIADYGGGRKRFLFIYTALSIGSVFSLSFIGKGMFFEGFLLIMAANIGMEGGLVFYNSFLPSIAPKQYHGRVSSWGYMVGYSGSIISLLFSLYLMETSGIESIWIATACFFALFSLPLFILLPEDMRTGMPILSAGRQGIFHTLRTIRDIWRVKASRYFLLAFLIYEDGVNTVIVFSSIFAATTLGFQPHELIFLYITVQGTAFVGSLAMARPTDSWGPKKVVFASLLLWSSVAVIAYFIHSKIYFWLLASCAGFGLGTVQAASRAFYVQFIPEGKEAEYFGVYAFVGKSSAIFGPLLFGYMSNFFGNQRPAILSVAVFFIVGFILLAGVKGGGPNIRKSTSPHGIM